jgi:hypothetical protein
MIRQCMPEYDSVKRSSKSSEMHSDCSWSSLSRRCEQSLKRSGITIRSDPAMRLTCQWRIGRIMENVNGRGKAPFWQQMSVFLISAPRSQSHHMPVADSNTLPGANPLRSTMWQGARPFAFAILRLVKIIGSKIKKRFTKPRHKLVRKSYQFLTHVVNRC